MNLVTLLILLMPAAAFAENPETSMRETESEVLRLQAIHQVAGGAIPIRGDGGVGAGAAGIPVTAAKTTETEATTTTTTTTPTIPNQWDESSTGSMGLDSLTGEPGLLTTHTIRMRSEGSLGQTPWIGMGIGLTFTALAAVTFG